MTHIWCGGNTWRGENRPKRRIRNLRRFILPILMGLSWGLYVIQALGIALFEGKPLLGAIMLLLGVAFFQKVGWDVWKPLIPDEVQAQPIAPADAVRRGALAAAPAKTEGAGSDLRAPAMPATRRLAAPQQKRSTTPKELLWHAPVSKTIH